MDTIHLSDEELSMRIEIDILIKFLDFCALNHDAKINITVAHDNGNTFTAHLYNHAALNQGLTDALEYFKSQL